MVKRQRPKAREDFAARLRLARQDRFRSQKSFADACGFQAETYRMWERGDREPSITSLKKIALALDESLDYLIVGKNRESESIENPPGPLESARTRDAGNWQWESDTEHRITIVSNSLIALDKTRQSYGINPTIPWPVVDVIMDNHEPLVDLKFQYVLNGRLKSASVSGVATFDPHGNFTGYRGTGRELKNEELATYLRLIQNEGRQAAS